MQTTADQVVGKVKCYSSGITSETASFRSLVLLFIALAVSTLSVGRIALSPYEVPSVGSVHHGVGVLAGRMASNLGVNNSC